MEHNSGCTCNIHGDARIPVIQSHMWVIFIASMLQTYARIFITDDITNILGHLDDTPNTSRLQESYS
jgi:hypothetical protein